MTRPRSAGRDASGVSASDDESGDGPDPHDRPGGGRFQAGASAGGRVGRLGGKAPWLGLSQRGGQSLRTRLGVVAVRVLDRGGAMPVAWGGLTRVGFL